VGNMENGAMSATRFFLRYGTPAWLEGWGGRRRSSSGVDMGLQSVYSRRAPYSGTEGRTGSCGVVVGAGQADPPRNVDADLLGATHELGRDPKTMGGLFCFEICAGWIKN